ncbi:hypothetical protein [Arthrobacter sp. FW306-04-A]|uniref:hypothetical protein n=1 Tax=Arthrobacter sp. FW306-04-A TaxID=2879619 RepID=UPI0037BE9ECF|nr:hypothetical protein LFT43_19880 [Arthrobacter sp. FW306-04-A]
MQIIPSNNGWLTGPPTPESVIYGGFAVFTSQGDGKDWDTTVELVVGSDPLLNPWMHLSSTLNHLDDQDQIRDGADRFVPLSMLVAGVTWNTVRAGKVGVIIKPNGHDTWNFNLRLFLAGTDGTFYEGKNQDLITLDQVNTTIIIPFQ